MIDWESPEVPSPEALHEEKRTVVAIDKAIRRLSPAQRKVISRRFGFDGSQGKDTGVTAIARRYGVDQSRVRHVEDEAIFALYCMLGRKL